MTLATSQINLRDAYAVWRRDVEVHLRLWKMNLNTPELIINSDWNGETTLTEISGS